MAAALPSGGKGAAACVAIGRMKLLVFAGSTRRHSFTRRLARVAAGMAAASGAEVTHIELGDFNVPMYNADLEAEGTPPDVMRLKQLAFDHPAWIVCTPEYNASYPALSSGACAPCAEAPLPCSIQKNSTSSWSVAAMPAPTTMTSNSSG